MQERIFTMRRTTTLRNAVWATLGTLALLTAANAAPGYPGGDPHSGAYLGVHVNDLTQDQVAKLKVADTNGAVILSIDQDGPACRAGLKANDVIVAVNGNKVENTQQLAQMMRNMQGGKEAIVTIVRNGQSQDIKVMLGVRNEWMAASHPPTSAPMAPVVPPMAYMAPPDIQVYTPTSARNGVTVESLSPQLSEYFGVPRGQGVLVRAVQKASPAANAGIKAGDVIVKVNGEIIRDLADWRRTMRTLTGKASVLIMREKREQVVELTFPGPTSGLNQEPQDWIEFDRNMDSLNEQMEKLAPELAQQAMMLNQDDLDDMQRDIEKSMKQQSKEMEKSMKKLEPQLQKQAKEMQKQAEALRKEMEKMTPELMKQGMEIEKSVMPTPQDIDAMSRLAADQMKAVTPKIQQKMDEWRKKMEERDREMQEQIRKQTEQADHSKQL